LKTEADFEISWSGSGFEMIGMGILQPRNSYYLLRNYLHPHSRSFEKSIFFSIFDEMKD